MEAKEMEMLFDELKQNLKGIEIEEDNPLQQYKRNILAIEDALQKLRKLVADHVFENREEEIEFFKITKPSVTSKLLFNIYMFNIESKRIRSSGRSDKEYLEGEKDSVHAFLKDNEAFYSYYKTGAEYLDKRYFTRGVKDVHILLNNPAYTFDEAFSTSHDHLLASIMAKENLLAWIEEELRNMERKATAGVTALTKLNWTESKAALVELVYALCSTGAINYGNVQLNDVAAAFEMMFNTRLDGYYRTYLEIRLRKNHRTKFLDHLKESLLKKMEEDDGK
jgi:hypothetical protein